MTVDVEVGFGDHKDFTRNKMSFSSRKCISDIGEVVICNLSDNCLV